MIFLPVDAADVVRLSGDMALVGRGFFVDGIAAFLSIPTSLIATTSGPVDRMKSAKSRVVSNSGWAFLGGPFADLAVAGLEYWLGDDVVSREGPVACTIGALDVAVAFDRSPFDPLSDTIERLVDGRPASTEGGPDDRMKSARSAVSVRL